MHSFVLCFISLCFHFQLWMYSFNAVIHILMVASPPLKQSHSFPWVWVVILGVISNSLCVYSLPINDHYHIGCYQYNTRFWLIANYCISVVYLMYAWFPLQPHRSCAKEFIICMQIACCNGSYFSRFILTICTQWDYQPHVKPLLCTSLVTL